MTSNKKNVRKSPLVPRQLNSTWISSSNAPTTCVQNVPLITLSSQNVIKLEDLLLEGDSLEVSLDETLHIGRILQVTNLAAFSLMSRCLNKHVDPFWRQSRHRQNLLWWHFFILKKRSWTANLMATLSVRRRCKARRGEQIREVIDSSLK